MPIRSFYISQTTEKIMLKLRVMFNVKNQAEVIRMGIALLDMAQKARENNQYIALVNEGVVDIAVHRIDMGD